MIELLENRSLLCFRGVDAEKFLQGQVTNDVLKNKYSYNFMLNNQGRYLFDFFVLKQASDLFYIDINKSSVSKFIDRISLYKLRSDFIIEDASDEFYVLYSNLEIKDAFFSTRDPRYKKLGFRSIVKRENFAANQANSVNLYLNDKYKFSIVDGYIDLIYEKSIPVEYGADHLLAVDYNKGCYIGQEVISRTKYQGVIRKKIYKVKFDTEVAPIQDNLEITDLDGNKIGILCSCYENLAIVLLREEKYLGLRKKSAIIGGKEGEIFIPEWRM
jgi:tRNA-modifying protein YgfZ